MTLAEKAQVFLDACLARHVRPPGLVEKCLLKTRGDLSTWAPRDDDNDGQYTAMYLGMQSYRYAVTKDPQAKANAKQAYDALPRSMQAWVDQMAGGVGPRAAKARHALAEELLAWRHSATKSKKARKELAKAITEGPPGPERAVWKAVESGLTMVSAALARRAIARFISGPPAAPAASEPVDGGGPGPREYSGFSTLARNEGS